MSEPTTRAEYEAKFHANHKVSGFGLGTTCHVPCPWCAEPEFMVYRVIDTSEALAKGAVCKHCHRGMRCIEKRTTCEHGNVQIAVEMVQTVGPDAPKYDWLPPMRRDVLQA